MDFGVLTDRLNQGKMVVIGKEKLQDLFVTGIAQRAGESLSIHEKTGKIVFRSENQKRRCVRPRMSDGRRSGQLFGFVAESLLHGQLLLLGGFRLGPVPVDETEREARNHRESQRDAAERE